MKTLSIGKYKKLGWLLLAGVMVWSVVPVQSAGAASGELQIRYPIPGKPLPPPTLKPRPRHPIRPILKPRPIIPVLPGPCSEETEVYYPCDSLDSK